MRGSQPKEDGLLDMAEEENGNDKEVDEGQDDPKKTAATPSRRATRSIRRARSLYVKNGWEPSNEAAFLMQEANLLILIDLADAIRGRVEESPE